MSEHPASSATRQLPSALAALHELALDLRTSECPEGQRVWQMLDPERWAATHNAPLLLQTVRLARLEQLARDPSFLHALSQVPPSVSQPSWCARSHPRLSTSTIAYFSMEFGLSHTLPCYAGGLGVLAGDFLKSASDLGVPVSGVGILFRQGSFRQRLTKLGQDEIYPGNDPGSLPIQPLLHADGSRLRVSLSVNRRTVWLRSWLVRVGGVSLYLLDSNDPQNSPADRMITRRLYENGKTTRLLQEMVLGIGGWRLLRALDVRPTIAHLNEGHAAFAILERACSLARERGHTLREALWLSSAGNVFTTHTSISAGFDSFDARLIARNLLRSEGDFADFDPHEILALGQRSAGKHSGEPFNMATLALRGSVFVNCVSQAHEGPSRHVLSALLEPQLPRELPLIHITNGVHGPSWAAEEAQRLCSEQLGSDWWRAEPVAAPALDDERLWRLRNTLRGQLIAYVRCSLAQQLQQRGVHEAAQQVAMMLRPDVLTLCFARRFTGYKRPELLLRQPERLVRLLTSSARPAQLVIAGKAHPADTEGKQQIALWLDFMRRPELGQCCVFLPDYDLASARQLVQGADLWLNTPRKPWEACGTSGMKVVLNGGLNISSRDGWWAEAEAPELGWSFGEDAQASDDQHAEELFTLLEQSVLPAFYERDERGLPRRWLARIQASMSSLGQRFGSQRMLREYVERLYAPADRELLRRSTFVA